MYLYGTQEEGALESGASDHLIGELTCLRRVGRVLVSDECPKLVYKPILSVGASQTASVSTLVSTYLPVTDPRKLLISGHLLLIQWWILPQLMTPLLVIKVFWLAVLDHFILILILVYLPKHRE